MINNELNFFSNCRILDLADEKGAFTSRLLADLGADVVKIEPPQGDRTRFLPPFFHDDAHHEKSLYFLFFNLNKRSITLNLEHADGRNIFRQLVKKSDIVVESYAPDYLKSLGLDYESLEVLNPRLVMASITHFGQSGPMRDFKSSDLVDMAMSGHMQMCGEPGATPIRQGIDHSYVAASLYAASGIAMALEYRERSGHGQYIDVSIQEAMSTFAMEQGQAATWFVIKENPVRTGTHMVSAFPGGAFQVKDGWICMLVWTAQEWDAFAQWAFEVTGNKEWLDPMYKGVGHTRAQYVDYLTMMFEHSFLPKFTKNEFFHEAARRGIVAFPVSTIADVLDDIQLNSRNFFVEVEHPVMGKIKGFAKMPYHCEDLPWKVQRSAPLLGQHNEEIYCGELGFSKDYLVAFKAAHVI